VLFPLFATHVVQRPAFHMQLVWLGVGRAVSGSCDGVGDGLCQVCCSDGGVHHRFGELCRGDATLAGEAGERVVVCGIRWLVFAEILAGFPPSGRTDFFFLGGS